MILDTHVWIWVVEGSKSQLSEATVRKIDAASRRGEIPVSAMSVRETAHRLPDRPHGDFAMMP